MEGDGEILYFLKLFLDSKDFSESQSLNFPLGDPENLVMATGLTLEKNVLLGNSHLIFHYRSNCSR